MQAIVLVTAILLLIYVGAMTNPQKAKTIVAELKRRWRLALIKRYGERQADEFFQEFVRLAEREGIEQKLVDELTQKKRDEVVKRFGSKEAKRRLGDPTPLERWY